jgi:putative SOS response-associated peptidase YedK
MCGRYVLFTPGDELARVFDVARLVEIHPRYNIAPTQDAPVMRIGDDGAREMANFRWGLIPAAARTIDDGPRPINARSETIRSRPMFREAFKSRRCIIPADGFYEWKKINPGSPDEIRQPLFIRLDRRRPFAMAGLWEQWQPPDLPEAPPVQTFTILTTDASDKIRPLHDRMPVILDPAGIDQWLKPGADEDRLLALCRPLAPDLLHFHPVSRRVNRADAEGPACIEETEEEQPRQRSLFG